MTDSLYSLSISQLAPLLARREVSPVEVTEQLLDRIANLDGELHAYLTVDAD